MSMKSICPIENLQPADTVDRNTTGDGYVKRRRRTIESCTSPTYIDNSSTIGETAKKIKSDVSFSSPDASSQSSEKEDKFAGVIVSGPKELQSFTSLNHGLISVIGRRRVMEDAVTVAPAIIAGDLKFDFFAVYDGHGGSRVSRACSKRLHHLVASEVEGVQPSGGGTVDWKKVMLECFAKMDEEVNLREDVGAEKTVGSTAVVVLVGKEEVVVANCGDSRVVLCRAGATVPLSSDHKPDRPDEQERVEAAGGRVIEWNGSRVLGVLATSRSIGDNYLKPYVTSEPEVIVRERSELDEFLIIASDGLWDVISNEFACEVARRCLRRQIKRKVLEEVNGSRAAEAATLLTELAIARGSKDNISIIVVELKKLGNIS